MSKLPKILAIIPARGGSKGIPGKNIKLLAGKPLLTYTIESAKGSKYIDRMVISTEDRNIADVAVKSGTEVIDRPKDLAQDETPMIPIISQVIDFLETKNSYRPDLILLLQPTSPLRTAKHIDEAVEKFLSGDFDSLLSVDFIYEHRFEIDEDNRLIPAVQERSNRQQRKPVVLENGAIYITKPSLIKSGRILGDKIGYYRMEKDFSVDIDTPTDLFMAEQLIIKNKQNQ